MIGSGTCPDNSTLVTANAVVYYELDRHCFYSLSMMRKSHVCP
jgi:hypothetical protein